MARQVRSVEERVAALDEKINKKKAEIAILEEKKHRLLHPVSAKSIIDQAKQAGMSLEDIAEKLGVEL
ncbi:hypothetical protein B5G34_00135 [Flavonifractor sp. An82]|uniref:hypothetical protein n=1 Tax=Flavonifractor sp. An82 TaxID=1965660 RepID=UPI000B36A045|nr:hypothetical protein [Flavonifractor sp. An82]OUN23559.1 hypothetical protein B5G34_00135 [Flavonifractor sp. An82]